jgi:hypothetical protein
MNLWDHETVVVKAKVLNPAGMKAKAPRKPWENGRILPLGPWIKVVGENPVKINEWLI